MLIVNSLLASILAYWPFGPSAGARSIDWSGPKRSREFVTIAPVGTTKSSTIPRITADSCSDGVRIVGVELLICDVACLRTAIDRRVSRPDLSGWYDRMGESHTASVRLVGSILSGHPYRTDPLGRMSGVRKHESDVGFPLFKCESWIDQAIDSPLG